MTDVINNIIKNKTPCYFISPNYGDAAASAGELMAELAEKVDITVITIFTNADVVPTTLSAKRFLKLSKAPTIQKLYEQRALADAHALSLLPAKRENLGFTDGLFRSYTSYRHVMSGKFIQDDAETQHNTSLRKKLHTLIPQNSMVFCPLGVFSHVDYLLVRNICQELFKQNCIFYNLPIEDFSDKEKNTFIKTNVLIPSVFTTSSEKKYAVIKAYNSYAVPFLTDTDMIFRPEIYYVPRKGVRQLTDTPTITIHTSLSDDLLWQWHDLWESSTLKNFFNSPLWFQACLKTFGYTEMFIVTCYKNNQLVGILPLVKTKQYGISAYMTPGRNYYDNSSLLLTDYNPEVIQVLVQKALDAGNLYLSELRLPIITSCAPMKHTGIAPASQSPYLRLAPDPHRFLSKQHVKLVQKKCSDAEKDISCTISLDGRDALQYVSTLANIDAVSTKKDASKETFSDPLLATLLTNLHNLDKQSVAIALLTYKQEPIAYNYGFRYDTTFIGTGTAFKKTWKHLIPGKLLLYLLLPLLQKQGIMTIDFSRGISVFKKDFSPYTYHQYILYASKNPLVMIQWRILTTLRHTVEQHPVVFERLRRIKKRLFFH